MDEEDDPHDDVTIEDAIERLETMTGDQYILPEDARAVVKGFEDELEDALPEGSDAMGASGLWANRYVANISVIAKDARGIPNVPQYQTIVLVEHLSESLATDLGVTVGKGGAIGHARSSREAHATTTMNLGDKYL